MSPRMTCQGVRAAVHGRRREDVSRGAGMRSRADCPGHIRAAPVAAHGTRDTEVWVPASQGIRLLPPGRRAAGLWPLCSVVSAARRGSARPRQLQRALWLTAFLFCPGCNCTSDQRLCSVHLPGVNRLSCASGQQLSGRVSMEMEAVYENIKGNPRDSSKKKAIYGNLNTVQPSHGGPGKGCASPSLCPHFPAPLWSA